MSVLSFIVKRINFGDQSVDEESDSERTFDDSNEQDEETLAQEYREVAEEESTDENGLTESSVKTTKILLVASFRTGSSFVGDLIQSSPGVFYSYEPLIYDGMNQTNLIKSILDCQLPSDYLKFINGKTKGGDINFMKRNLRGWNGCKHKKSSCYSETFMNELCASFPIQLIKVVRLRVRDLEYLLENDPSTSDWKIIYLMRDPRGTMASRSKLKWCMKKPICGNITRLCNDMMDDLDRIEKLISQDPEHHYLLRFEDISANVKFVTEKLMKFLGMSVNESIKKFLEKHTQREKKGKHVDEFSTNKNTKSVAHRWRHELKDSKIYKMSKICQPVLMRLNYMI